MEYSKKINALYRIQKILRKEGYTGDVLEVIDEIITDMESSSKSSREVALEELIDELKKLISNLYAEVFALKDELSKIQQEVSCEDDSAFENQEDNPTIARDLDCDKYYPNCNKCPQVGCETRLPMFPSSD